jgi:hypothetical protein
VVIFTPVGSGGGLERSMSRVAAFKAFRDDFNLHKSLPKFPIRWEMQKRPPNSGISYQTIPGQRAHHLLLLPCPQATRDKMRFFLLILFIALFSVALASPSDNFRDGELDQRDRLMPRAPDPPKTKPPKPYPSKVQKKPPPLRTVQVGLALP